MQLLNLIKTFAFPEIKNWKRDYPEYKNEEEWWKLPAFILIVFNKKGGDIFFLIAILTNSIIFIALSAFLLFSKMIILFFITMIIGGITIYKLYKWKNKLKENNTTLYNMYFQQNYNGESN